jgi:lipopolysaccharide transport protein LptA
MKKNKKMLCFLLASIIYPTNAHADLLDEDASPISSDDKAEPDSGKSSANVQNAPPKKDVRPSDGGISPSKKTSVIPSKTDLPKSKNSKKNQAKSKEPVHFESKGLKGLREKGLVELVDNVVVTQGDLRLEADKAQVFFDEAAHDVVKVIAEGNVKIFNIDENTGEKLKAYGNQVVFLNKERRVIMEGNARLWRGDDSVIRGKKITYEMDTGWIRADRVAGELSPSEKDKK